jgi:hypothetical protein
MSADARSPIPSFGELTRDDSEPAVLRPSLYLSQWNPFQSQCEFPVHSRGAQELEAVDEKELPPARRWRRTQGGNEGGRHAERDWEIGTEMGPRL